MTNLDCLLFLSLLISGSSAHLGAPSSDYIRSSSPPPCTIHVIKMKYLTEATEGFVVAHSPRVQTAPAEQLATVRVQPGGREQRALVLDSLSPLYPARAPSTWSRFPLPYCGPLPRLCPCSSYRRPHFLVMLVWISLGVVLPKQ